MAASIRIFFSEGSGGTVEREGPALNVDLSSLEAHYHERGKRHVKGMARFLEFWESEGAALMAPRARMALMTAAEAEEAFGPEVLRHLSGAAFLTLSVWTLGIDLERRSGELMSSEGAVMQGFLLDVAGSIALYTMHNVLLDWMEREFQAIGKVLTGEFYPGLGGVDAALMEKIASRLGTRDTIGVEARSVSMLHPRKTQCSFVGAVAGTAQSSRVVIEPKPCVPCQGERCLYHQLGGCHMALVKGLRGGSRLSEADAKP
ncbi:MAG: hypothetical protein GX256_03435 [Fretibacterium sp.]|nr:hypothetical protein [Fretibacterium sp.]